MGNPLSPILADIVMEKLFNESLKQLTRKPTFIKKYVDDVILAIPKDLITSTKQIFEFFNESIKFTIEEEINNSITFLDLKLYRTDSKIITNWHQKDTASGRLLNFLSSHPQSMKINIAKSFIKRVTQLSDNKFLKENIQRIKHILSKNNYPDKLVNRLIYKTIFTNNNITNTTSTNANSTTTTDSQSNIIFGSITYVPQLTEKCMKIINSNQQRTRIANKTINTSSNVLFTKLKDKIPHTDIANVVYKIPCLDCPNKSYIGHTSKALSERLKQHKRNILNQSEMTALAKHSKLNNHSFNFPGTKILEIETKKPKRETLEMIHIHLNQENTVNHRSDTQFLSFNQKTLLNIFKSIKH